MLLRPLSIFIFNLLSISSLEASELTEMIFLHYGNSIIAFSVVLSLIFFTLFYWLFRYKKSLKVKNEMFEEQKKILNQLQELLKEKKLEMLARGHEVEKNILELNYKIKTLEAKEKQGLKSEVVSKIEALQSLREKRLERLNFE